MNSHVKKGDITESEARHADEVIKKEIQDRAKVLREKHKTTSETNGSSSAISNDEGVAKAAVARREMEDPFTVPDQAQTPQTQPIIQT